MGFFVVFFNFPKSAQVGLRLPDTHLQQQGFFLFHLHVSGGGRKGKGQEGREKMGKIHLLKSHKKTYVPSIMEVCAPQQLAPHWFSSDIYFGKKFKKHRRF